MQVSESDSFCHPRQRCNWVGMQSSRTCNSGGPRDLPLSHPAARVKRDQSKLSSFTSDLAPSEDKGSTGVVAGDSESFRPIFAARFRVSSQVKPDPPDDPAGALRIPACHAFSPSPTANTIWSVRKPWFHQVPRTRPWGRWCRAACVPVPSRVPTFIFPGLKQSWRRLICWRSRRVCWTSQSRAGLMCAEVSPGHPL